MPPRGKAAAKQIEAELRDAELREAEDEMTAIQRRLEEENKGKNMNNPHNLSASEGSSEESSLMDSLPRRSTS